MAHYYLDKKGYGSSYYYNICSCSETQAKKLRKDGIKIFNSKSEAEEYVRSKKKNDNS